MKNPLSLPVERAIGAGLLLAALWLWLSAERGRAADAALARQALREAGQRISIWKAQYAEAVTVIRHDTVTITRRAARTDTLRDTVLAHVTDTVLVREYVHAADSTIRACRDLVTDCTRFHVVADSTIRAVERQRDAALALARSVRPRWYDRLGANVGYGIVTDGTTVRAGPVVALSLRVWP